MSQPHGLPGKYASLNDYLAALPAGQQSVTLTFTELGALLGAALPASARTTAPATEGGGAVGAMNAYHDPGGRLARVPLPRTGATCCMKAPAGVVG